MLRLRTASLGAAVALLAVACSSKPADNAATADSVSAATSASAAPTDTAMPAPSPAAASADTTARTAAAAPTSPAKEPSAKTTSSAGAMRVSPPVAADSTRKAKPATTTKPATETAKPPATAKPAAAAAPSTTAAPTTAAPAAAAPAAAEAQSGSVKVNRFMSYDAAAKRVNLEIIAAFNSQQGGFNFNGGSNGSHTITVPAGWQVQMHVKNIDAIPHSAIVIADQRPLPNAPDTPAIPRAYTSHVNDGLQPQSGADDLSFRASKPGNYLIYCGVPGHGPSGMFIKFVVSESATTPSYQM